MNGYEWSASMLKALAHPVRLQILEVLEEEGEACVCHLECRLDQRQAYISQQLAKLREAGLVQHRREGLNVFYSVPRLEFGRLLDATKELVVAVGRVQGLDLAVDDIQRIPPGDCLCPTCEENLSASPAR